MANPCKYTLKDGTVLDFTQARQYVMDNIAELTKDSPTLKSKYDAAIKGKVEEGNKPEYKEGDKGREGAKAGGRNRSKQSKAIPEEIRTPDVVAVFNMLGEAIAQEAAETVAPIVQEEVKPMTARERADAIADNLDRLADEIGNQTNSSLPFLPQAVRAALKAAASLMRSNTGATLVELTDAALKALRINAEYAGLTDAQKIEIEADLTDKIAKNSVEFIETQKGSGEFKVSETARKFIAGLREQQRNDLADIVEAGKDYEVRNQKKVMADAIALMDADRTGNIAYKLAKNGELHPDITNAIFAQRLIDAMAAHSAKQDATTTEAFELANKEYQNYGTYIAQGLSMRNYLAQMIPFMMVDRVKNKATNDVKNKLGPDGINKTKKVATEAKQIRRSVFTAIAAVVSGQDVNIKDLSNPKIKKALDVLVSFGVHLNKNGATKSGLAQLLELVAQDGKLAVNGTREQVRELVTTNLTGINQALKENMMTDAQVEKAINAFMEVYEDIASAQMEKSLDRAFGDNSKTPSISKSKNPTIVKQILYGALEGDSYIDKFAVKYGLPILTPENIAKLTELAEDVAAARTRGAFAIFNATSAFNNYLNALKAKASGGVTGFIEGNAKMLNYIAAYQFNNLLLRFSILSKALISNLLQTFPKIVMQIARERSFKLGGTFNIITTNSIDPVTNKEIKIVLSPTKDNITFGILGINKEGRSDIETDILNQKSKIKRAFSKVFIVGSSRFFAVTDAITIPIATAITSRQAYGALLKAKYPSKSRSDISNDITALLGRDETTVSAAFSKAMDEMRNSKLWTESGFNSTTPFPQDPGIKKIGTKEARIYNETKIRMYELLSEGVMERLIQLNQNIDPALSTNEALEISEEQQKEINRYISANTREISFLGRPQGTAGQLADVLNYISSGRLSPLKHSTLMPLFNNAVANGFSLFIKYDPLSSTFRSIKYKTTGKRGLTPKEQDRSYKLDFMLKMDQARLRESMFAAYAITAGLLGMLYKLRGGDDDEERRRKAAKGKGTFIATKEMEGRGLVDASGDPIKGGYIYIDGVQSYNWGVSPFYGAISAAAALDNYRVFETATAKNTGGIRRPFVEDDEGLKSAVGMYLMNTLSGVMNYSSMAQQYKTLSDLMQLTQESNKSGKERTGEALLNVFANMIQSFVPLSGLQKDAQNAYDAYNGNPQMLALDFFEKMSVNLAFVDGALRSNKTDCFGRPVEEELKAVGPALGIDLIQFDKGEVSLPFNRKYEDDSYMQMHTMHNYYPNVYNSTIIPDVIGIEREDDLEIERAVKLEKYKYYSSVSESETDRMILELKGNKRLQAESIKKEGEFKKYPNVIKYNLELTAQENQKANEEMGKMVKTIFDHVTEEGETNMNQMMKFDNNEQYKECMTSLYSICKKVAVINDIKEMQSQEMYIRSAIRSINSWDKKYIFLEFPENIREKLEAYVEAIEEKKQ